MKAVGYRRDAAGASGPLIDFDAPEPEPRPTDLLVDIRAVSMNPVDWKVRARRTPEPGATDILGWDAAGIVLAAGPETEGFAPGDRVFYAGDLTRPGSNAERQAVDHRIVGRMPESLDFAAAAALPLTALTAWEMLFDRLSLPERGAGRLLIVGAAGGVGSIAVQLARALTDAAVIGTASRPETAEWVRTLGAQHVVDHRGDLAAQVSALAPDGVDAVISTNATEQHLDALAAALRPQGKFGLIDDPATFDIAKLKPKSLSLHWEFMFTRSMFETPDIAEQSRILNRVAELVDAGTIRSTHTETLGPIDAATLTKAHALSESGRAKGKMVLAR